MENTDKPFVFFVDSYGGRELIEGLLALGLTQENFHSTGAGGAGMLLEVPRWINAKSLLVFMSSFHGSVKPAVELAKKIKAANPNAKIVFRSTEHSDDPIFDEVMKKDFDFQESLKVVAGFLAEK